jgi:hypothetical protein
MAKIIGAVLIAFIFPLFANAAIVINEVMYDVEGTDTDREWVELYNNGSEAVVIVVGSGSGSWRFVDSSAHTLKLESGSATLEAGAYALVLKNMSQFAVDYPAVGGNIFSSAIALTNTAAAVSIKDGTGGVLDEFSYNKDQGAAGDGNSLQRSGDDWIAATPTPGAVNASEPTVIEDNDATDTDDDNDDDEVATTSSTLGSFTISVAKKRVVTVGSSVNFVAKPSRKAAAEQGRFEWSFGDGAANTGLSVEHTYDFPGTYVVMVNGEAGDYEASARTEVQVIEADVDITAVITEGKTYIEITNQTAYELNMSDWQLESASSTFDFPTGMMIKSKAVLRIPGSISTLSPQGEVSLRLPSGEVISTYDSSADKIAARAEELSVLTGELEAAKAELATLLVDSEIEAEDFGSVSELAPPPAPIPLVAPAIPDSLDLAAGPGLIELPRPTWLEWLSFSGLLKLLKE